MRHAEPGAAHSPAPAGPHESRPGGRPNCSPSGTSGSTNLITDYTYDYLSRLAVQRSFAAGAQTDKADYTYDALDRTVSETEDHASTGKDRTTALTYQGLSSLVTREEQSGGTNAKESPKSRRTPKPAAGTAGTAGSGGRVPDPTAKRPAGRVAAVTARQRWH